MLKKLSYNAQIAIEAIGQNKMRAILTSLGIIFGVASVIAMLAIGRGAQVEILEQMKLLGANNIIVRPVVEQKQGLVADDSEEGDTQQGQGQGNKRYSPGLTLEDARSIKELIPGVEMVSPEVVYETMVTRAGYRRSGRIVGVGEHFLDTSGFTVASGSGFTNEHHQSSLPVAVIGNAIKTRFFPKEDPIGKQIKCGDVWFTVVGVLDRIAITADNIQHLGIRDYNMDIYTPITTALIRYKNRAKFTPERAQGGMMIFGGGMAMVSGGRRNTPVDPNYHQIDRMVVRVTDTQMMPTVAEVMSRMLERRHNQVVDYEIVVPELLLKQEQRTKDIFNIVLAAIASISLIVGGIGIMNIMLASVMERIREIGVRMSLGATQKDIVLQFLSEAVAISINGGIIGIVLGVGFSYLIEHTTGIVTIVSPWSVVISFSVAITIGLVFGIFPARKAAMQDPATSLRYE
jgi:putative ABC transport system permease protein